ncbi:MAG: hypothetical protein ACOCT8_05190 [Actinomycetota bacterium]
MTEDWTRRALELLRADHDALARKVDNLETVLEQVLRELSKVNFLT